MVGLKGIAASGIRWTASSSLIVAVIQFVQVAVLAHLLSPSEFGLMAMVTIVLGLAQAYSDMGISNAIIYRQDTTPDELSSLYWLNIFAGIAAFLALMLGASLMAKVFDEPRLSPLIRLASLTFLIAPWGQQFQILLQKSLHFHVMAKVEIASAFAGGVIAVFSAYSGFGVYSLIFGQLTYAVVLALSYSIIGWRDWRPALHFRRVDLKGYLRYGMFQMGERSINFLSARTDQIFLGILLGSTALGYYNLAWGLVIQPVARINPILTRVAFPLFARIQTEIDRLRRGYLSLLWLLTTVNSPLLIGCAALAATFVPAIFGVDWIPAVPIVEILAFVGLTRSMGNPVGSLLLATGRADVGFYWNLGFLCAQVPAVYIGAKLGGGTGVAMGVLLVQLGSLIASYIFLIRPILGPCLSDYVKNALTAPILAIAMGFLMFFTGRFGLGHGKVLIGAQILIGVAAYTVLTLTMEKRHVQEIRSILFR